jgi:dTDP-4-dehydrorhamnose 3,5-epimerase
MRLTRAGIPGAWIVDAIPHVDARGDFARVFCAEAFAAQDLPVNFVQCNISRNARAATLRGLHGQVPSGMEGKLVRCMRGALFDVIADVRPGSPAYGQWRGFELTAENARAVYIPPGCVHGYQTLVDGTDLFYQMTTMYRPDLARGIRWNDPTLAIAWPLADPILSARDAALPHLTVSRPVAELVEAVSA